MTPEQFLTLLPGDQLGLKTGEVVTVTKCARLDYSYPTVVCRDREGHLFAVALEDVGRQVGFGTYDEPY